MTDLCYVQGRIVNEADAFVPVLDRGFLFGDSIYEVITTRRGRLFCAKPHLDRLRTSAERLHMELPWSDEDLLGICNEMIAKSGNAENYLRIIVTRGTGTAPNIDLEYAPKTPSLVILVRSLDQPATRRPADLLETGVSAWLVTTTRNDRRALDPAIKSGNYLNNILGQMEARRKGVDVALFLNSERKLTEAPTSNVWLVHAGRIRTPTIESGILAGITRGLLLEIGREQGLAMEEAELTADDLFSADEIFLSSTTRSIVPVTMLDGEPVGDGKPGPVTLDLAERYERYADQILQPPAG